MLRGCFVSFLPIYALNYISATFCRSCASEEMKKHLVMFDYLQSIARANRYSSLFLANNTAVSIIKPCVSCNYLPTAAIELATALLSLEFSNEFALQFLESGCLDDLVSWRPIELSGRELDKVCCSVTADCLWQLGLPHNSDWILTASVKLLKKGCATERVPAYF